MHRFPVAAVAIEKTKSIIGLGPASKIPAECFVRGLCVITSRSLPFSTRSTLEVFIARRNLIKCPVVRLFDGWMNSTGTALSVPSVHGFASIEGRGSRVRVRLNRDAELVSLSFILLLCDTNGEWTNAVGTALIESRSNHEPRACIEAILWTRDLLAVLYRGRDYLMLIHMQVVYCNLVRILSL